MADKGKESHRIGEEEKEEEEKEGEYDSNETVERDVEAAEAEEEQGESGDDVDVEGCEVSTSDEGTTTAKNRSFITELNLIMITAFLTLSKDELSQLDESEKLECAADKERQVAKAEEAAAKVQQSRRRPRECCGNGGAGGFKFADRRSVLRSQSSCIGSRHGRKT